MTAESVAAMKSSIIIHDGNSGLVRKLHDGNSGLVRKLRIYLTPEFLIK